MASSPVGINTGTTTFLPGDSVGTLTYPVTKIDIGAAGASSAWTGNVGVGSGTITTGSIKVTTGTVNAGTINTGTINTGTINIGTVDTKTALPLNYWGTTIQSSGTALGTLKALVSGSAIHITDIIISVGSASNVVIGNGSVGIPLLGTLNFNANGGIVSNFQSPLQATSGSPVVYQQTVAGPLSITANGFIK